MRALCLCTAAVLLGGAALLVPRTAVAEPDAAGAADVFRARCAHCHTIPDPALRTDRAWIDQVNRTA
mgnify:CR=1 FL=1